MKTCTGRRTADGCAVTVSNDGGELALGPRLDLRRLSLTGFEWGYGRSGPAQLALAPAADVLGDDGAALGVYQRLEFRVVARLAADVWTLTEDELGDTIRTLVRPDGE